MSMGTLPMRAIRLTTVLVLGTMGLTACGSTSDPMWPATAPGGAPRVDSAPLTPPVRAGAQLASPLSGVAPAPGQPAQTFVGQKAAAMRSDFLRLQGQINERGGQHQQTRTDMRSAAERYFATVAGINGRLQAGTTPGNPILTQQWNVAQSELDRIAEGLARLNNLSTAVAADSSLASYLAEQTRSAFAISGAVDEDHRALAQLEDEIGRSAIVIDRMQNELSDDVARQTAGLSVERRNLTTLAVAIKNGQMLGGSLATRAFAAPPAVTPGAAPAAQPGRRPLAVIRFDRPNPPYQQQVYSAVADALDRRPDVGFELMAVAPARAGSAGTATVQARRNAEAVMRALAEMGLGADRVALSQSTAADTDVNEVHVFLR
jgi:hypothetical protein